MDRRDLGDGAMVRESFDGVVIGKPHIYTDKELVYLTREQVFALHDWLGDWIDEVVRKQIEEGE